MPKRNGKEVYKERRRIQPDVTALFIGGNTAGTVHDKGMPDGALLIPSETDRAAGAGS